MTLTTPYFHQIFYKYPTDKHSLPWARRAHRHIATYTHPPIVGRIYPILMYSPIDIYPPNCWHDIYNTNTYIRLTNIPHPGPEGSTDTQQLTHAPQLLAEYIQYQCIHRPTYIPPIVGIIYTILIHISNCQTFPTQGPKGPQTPINFYMHTPLIVGRIYPISIYSPTDPYSPIVGMNVEGGECLGW